jgi:hypothetical protein
LKQPKLSEELHRRKKTNKPKPLNERLSWSNRFQQKKSNQASECW